MPKTIISTKGQIVIPSEIRQRLGWDPGTVITVEDLEDGVVLRRARQFPHTTIDDLLGCVPYDGPARSLEEMEQAIAKGAREHA